MILIKIAMLLMFNKLIRETKDIILWSTMKLKIDSSRQRFNGELQVEVRREIGNLA